MMLKSVTRKILDQLKGDNATQYEGAQSFLFGEFVSQLDGWIFDEKSSLWHKKKLIWLFCRVEKGSKNFHSRIAKFDIPYKS